MKCVICKQGDTKEGFTTVAFDKGNTTLVVRLVPAQVCENCGEAYLDEKATDSLLKRADEADKKGIRVEVVDYKAA